MNGDESLAPECSNQARSLTAMEEPSCYSCELASISPQSCSTEVLFHLQIMNQQKICTKADEILMKESKKVL
jgi:hypothetical protein